MIIIDNTRIQESSGLIRHSDIQSLDPPLEKWAYPCNLSNPNDLANIQPPLPSQF